MALVAEHAREHLPGPALSLVMESFAVARNHRCLEPPGDARAVSRLAALWQQLSGAKREGPNLGKYALGGGIGLIAGLIMGYGVKASYEELPVMLVALLGAAAGAGAAHFLKGNSGGWNYAMMKLIINERRSVVRKAMVTDQAEFWVPKALMLHRRHEWRRDRSGVTYMVLRLPYRARLIPSVHNMVDALALPQDLHVMLDSAGKGQRVWNRRLAKNGTAFGHLDDQEEPEKPLEAVLPYLMGGGMAVAGFVILMVVAQ